MRGSTTCSKNEEGYKLPVMADGNYAITKLNNNTIGSNFYFMKISNSESEYNAVNDNSEITTIVPLLFTSGGSSSAPSDFTLAKESLTTNTGGANTSDGFGGTLPIEPSSFIGVNKGSINVINWTTCSESNNDYFNIESSINGMNWKTVGKMNGIGNSNSLQHYSWVDNDPAFPVTYYRLKQTNFDGAFQYSNIIEISKESLTVFEITEIFPNPVTDLISFKYTGNDSKLNVFIYNGLGQLLNKIEFSEIQNGEKYNLNFTNLPNGVYFIKFLQDKIQFTSKIVK